MGVSRVLGALGVGGRAVGRAFEHKLCLDMPPERLQCRGCNHARLRFTYIYKKKSARTCGGETWGRSCSAVGLLAQGGHHMDEPEHRGCRLVVLPRHALCRATTSTTNMR